MLLKRLLAVFLLIALPLSAAAMPVGPDPNQVRLTADGDALSILLPSAFIALEDDALVLEPATKNIRGPGGDLDPIFIAGKKISGDIVSQATGVGPIYTDNGTKNIEGPGGDLLFSTELTAEPGIRVAYYLWNPEYTPG